MLWPGTLACWKVVALLPSLVTLDVPVSCSMTDRLPAPFCYTSVVWRLPDWLTVLVFWAFRVATTASRTMPVRIIRLHRD